MKIPVSDNELGKDSHHVSGHMIADSKQNVRTYAELRRETFFLYIPAAFAIWWCSGSHTRAFATVQYTVDPRTGN
jgi:hypothetical protein